MLAWAWTAPDKQFDFVADPGALTASNVDIHGDTEGDDLWTWYQQYLRTGNPLALVWARRWRDYFVNHYANSLSAEDRNFGFDHVYGWGLVLWGVRENDAAAITAAEGIGDMVIAEFGGSLPPASGSTGNNGGRDIARWLILFCYLAHATGKAKWVNWRNALIDRYAVASNWLEAPTMGIVQGGHYFCNRAWMSTNEQGGTGAYDAGRRSNSVFMYGLHAEAVWRAFLATGRADMRDKLVKMARFIQYYGHVPSHAVPFTGAFMGHQNGAIWHREGSSGAANCSYDASVVNTLVWGYKLTGDANLLARANAHFRQTTRWREGGPWDGSAALVGPTEVHAFVDTRRNLDLTYFTHNRGQLQYCYQLFENGGVPARI